MTRSHVFHRSSASTPPTAVRGEGHYLFDSDGRSYFDASGGAAVSCLGHSHPDVVAAIHAQLDELPYAHTGFFTSQPAEALAALLCDMSGGAMDRVYFVSGGSEAMEAALKVARQYFLERGEPGRSRFIARRQSYHGNTLGALAVGGNAWRRQPFEPLLAPAVHVSPCYTYRDRAEGESDDAYADRLAAELESAIVAVGAESVIGFVAETVGGATAGVIPPVPGYFQRVRDVCNRYGILLILDEVMCGMGRTGQHFAYADEGIEPDIVAIAKGLGAGYQPIGAMLTSATVHDTIEQGSGFFQHGHTYMGHTTACAGALAVQNVIRRDDLLANVRAKGARLEEALQDRFGNHAHVGNVRGRGLFYGIEFVADRVSKAPFDPALNLHARVKAAALRHGLMCYAMGGTIDGQRGNHVMLAPPFTIDDDDVALITSRLGDAVDEAIGSL
ncbi:MAG: aspartate aminotransferase family protein [Pseudomonadota bacterium]